MAYTCVRVTFEIGHEASIRAKKTSEGFTHDWELFVRGSDNTEIHHFVEKVIFHLHESFRNPKRVVKEPPYVVRESGYAGFALPIDIYLKNKHEPSKIRFNYQLTLQESGPPISSVKREKYVFKNPSEDFRRKLIRGGGVGVGADSASGSHTNHMAALHTDHSADDHRTLVNNKNKGSPQDGNAVKKSKKENTSKNEELSANDPFAIFGQPIKTSKIPLVSKSSSKQQISDKAPPPTEKQGQSSKSSKHSSSTHKDKDKDKDRGEKDRIAGGGEKEKEKAKDKEKDKDKNALKKSKDEVKKERIKDDKVRIIKTSKDDSKKNSYHEEKTKEKLLEKSLDRSGGNEKELKVDKKDKEKKHKEEKKSKSKDKHKNNEKKENIEVKDFADRTDKVYVKDEFKEEKKFHKIVDDKDEKIEKIGKEKAVEPKNLFSNSGNVNNADSQSVVNNGDSTRKEEKHKHHKHKKDKSKKDNKREKEEKKEKKESKENKEKPPPQPVEVAKSTPKSDSPKRNKKPLKKLFEELSDKSDSDLSSLDDELITRVTKERDSPDVNVVKEEPVTYAKQEEQTKEEKFENGSKKKKKSSEDRENKKRKRKSKDKEENVNNKMIKYENSTENAIKTNSIELTEHASEQRPKSMSPASETKFTDEYITKLKELQRKIMTLEDNSGLQQIVQVVAETGQYEITTKTFDFDLCTLDESIVQRLLDFFVP